MMKQNSKVGSPRFLPAKMVAVMAILLSAVTVMTLAFTPKGDSAGNGKRSGPVGKDSVKSVKAFMQVYSVLMSPRCMNCHPKGDVPLQGDDSHLHTMAPKRGKDGTGVYAMKCTNCHQPENTPGLHTPPGNPKWQLPPAEMKMVFEGKTPRELALQIMDFNRNGHKDKEKLLEHARDTLVKAGWDMGGGRKPPPLAYDKFLVVWDAWIESGAYAPGRTVQSIRK